jgi:FtsZ-binding cell division protein ZapB
MNTTETINLLTKRIKNLKEELDQNPQYKQNIKESILDDIDYYQNHLNHLNDTL